MKTATSVPSVKPTVEHAQSLGRIYSMLYKARKAVQTAERELKAAWSKGLGVVDECRTSRNAAVKAFDAVADDAWAGLTTLPNGTTAPGGATPQTVALEFYSSNLNRNLQARITSSDAKKINARSFA